MLSCVKEKLVKSNITEISNCSIEPMIDNFQMVGDSLCVRLGNKILNNQVQHLHTRIGINRCIGGNKIENLLEIIMTNQRAYIVT